MYIDFIVVVLDKILTKYKAIVYNLIILKTIKKIVLIC